MLTRYHNLPRGPRVCVRLVRPRDRHGIEELFSRQRREGDELEIARLINFDVCRRFVLCATALVDSREQVLGLGVIELGGEAGNQPSLIVADEERTDGLAQLLHDALVEHADVIRRARAA